ncbi:hypothetical protein R1flu_019080 [Riccia fluitans]|uniref:Uncharacterized protein n=1 Tax=Riccia fluitans TaxID=41844 RepID=A0ABD1ZHX6_9MARC
MFVEATSIAIHSKNERDPDVSGLHVPLLLVPAGPPSARQQRRSRSPVFACAVAVFFGCSISWTPSSTNVSTMTGAEIKVTSYVACISHRQVEI